MNSFMDVPMDFQFFEIQFFEKTMKQQSKNHGKTMKNQEKPMTLLINFIFPPNGKADRVSAQAFACVAPCMPWEPCAG